MKKRIIILPLFILLLFSCGEQSNSNEDTAKAEEVARLEEQVRLEKQKSDSINKALSAITVRIYNHSPLYFDSEGWCVNEAMGNKVKTTEVKDFIETKSYSCADGNYIQKLTIEGVFNGITIQFTDDKDKVVKEFNNYNLVDAVTYSGIDHQPSDGGIEKKDKFYQEWFEKASKINLMYNDSIFYSGKWKSSGWYIQ